MMNGTREAQVKNGYDLLYLAACALQDRVPEDAVVRKMDLTAVYALSVKQMLPAITCYSIEKWLAQTTADSAADAELLAKWKDAKNRAIRKNVMLDIERENLFAFMETQGIWYMPLKGSILKDWYPQVGMRQMSDNDILFDPAFQKTIYEHMVGRGFQLDKEESTATHDCYHKKPFYNFEMHLSLFGYSAKSEWRAYYENVKRRLVKDEGNLCGYHFTDEDLYVYMTTHACKHFNVSGHGVRQLLDVCVFLQKKPNVDWTYIEAELAKMGLADHEKKVRGLANKLLDPELILKMEQFDVLTEQEHDILMLCMAVGAFGSQEHRTQNALNEISGDKAISLWDRVKYLFRRVIPSLEVLEGRYPIVKKHKLLVPVFMVYRLYKGIEERPKQMWNEFTLIWKTKK